MDLIGWYVLFAVTTSLTFMYEVFSPVMKQLEIVNSEDNMVQSKGLSYAVYFLIGVLIAPLLLPVCLIPSFSDRFRKTLLNTLLGP